MKSLFALNHRDLATALRGKHILLPDGRVLIVTDTEGFACETNAKGVYKPLLGQSPGTMFFPKQRFHILPLVACLDQGEVGGCVLLKGAEVDGMVITGPAGVTKVIGVTQAGSLGSLEELPDGRLKLSMTGTLTPSMPKGARPVKAATFGLTDADLSPHMLLIAQAYRKVAGEDDTLEGFLNGLKGDFDSIDTLLEHLRGL